MRIVFSLMFLLSLTACSNSKPLYIHLNAAPTLNQNHEKHSYPLMVKIFLLEDDNAFQEASFKDLWKQEDKKLGKSLLAKMEVTISPDEYQKVKMKLPTKAKFIGVVGIFQHPDRHNYKDIKPIEYAKLRLFNRAQVQIENKCIEFIGG